MTDTDRDITIYRADWVLPVAAPVLPDGGVAVGGDGRIVAVGPAPRLIAEHPGAAVVDTGRSIVMPGFVNCHSHMEYTTFRGILDDAEFSDWIISLVDVKASLTPDEYLISAQLGALEALSSGITTVADTSYGAATLEAAGTAGLRGRLYLEVFGVDDARFDETMADVVRRLDAAQAAAPATLEVGLAPHAPYTVSSRLYQAVSALARERGLKVMSHVAESQDELTYVRSGSGKFAHDYREKMGWERMLVQPYGVTPIKYLQQWDVLHPDFLAVHCVNVTRDDIRILRAKNAAVAHCPKSNAKLGCGVAPLADLLHEGVRVGLGTDSPASSNIMDMFDEMRTMLLLHRAVERDVAVLDARQCVRIATLGGRRHWVWRMRSAASNPASGPTSSPSTSRARTSRRSPIRTRRSSTAPTRTTSRSRSSAGVTCTATGSTWTSTPLPSGPGPSPSARSFRTACSPAPSRSAAPTPAGGT